MIAPSPLMLQSVHRLSGLYLDGGDEPRAARSGAANRGGQSAGEPLIGDGVVRAEAGATFEEGRGGIAEYHQGEEGERGNDQRAAYVWRGSRFELPLEEQHRGCTEDDGGEDQRRPTVEMQAEHGIAINPAAGHDMQRN